MRISDCSSDVCSSDLTRPDYGTSDLEFDSPRRITDANPLQRDLRWMSAARMLNYTNDLGEPRRAALWLPAGYERGKAYPTIVNIYEEVGGGFNLYRAPRLPGDVNTKTGRAACRERVCQDE